MSRTNAANTSTSAPYRRRGLIVFDKTWTQVEFCRSIARKDDGGEILHEAADWSRRPCRRRDAGVGRGIARALGEAGATVYCTGRSVKGKPSPYRRPETLDETAAMITSAGGKAIAVRIDHTNEAQVKALFRRIKRAHKRVDVVVDSVAGEDPLMGWFCRARSLSSKPSDRPLIGSRAEALVNGKFVTWTPRRRSGWSHAR